MRTRIGFGLLGTALSLFGVYQLLRLGWGNLLGTLAWLGGGVVLHDGVLALATIAVVGAGSVLLPRRVRPPLAAAFIVLGTVTVTAVPVLGRFGARPDNPTLLDRDYVAGWLILFAVVVVATSAAVVLDGRLTRSRKSGD